MQLCGLMQSDGQIVFHRVRGGWWDVLVRGSVCIYSRLLFECHRCRLGSSGFTGDWGDGEGSDLSTVQWTDELVSCSPNRGVPEPYQKLKKSWTSFSVVPDEMPET